MRPTQRVTVADLPRLGWRKTAEGEPYRGGNFRERLTWWTDDGKRELPEHLVLWLAAHPATAEATRR